MIQTEISNQYEVSLHEQILKVFHTGNMRLDEQLNVPHKLKPYMSDVDLLIMNEVLFESIRSDMRFKPWFAKLGEKYGVGVGASPILSKLHQKLIGTSIGGYRVRLVNYIIIPNEAAYKTLRKNRNEAVMRAEIKLHKKIKIRDVRIIYEIIR